MSEDQTDPVTPATQTAGQPEANGYRGPLPHAEADPVRERFRLLAQCAKLRHWCRGLLDAEGTTGVLSVDAERELRETPPGMSMDEVFAALRVISQGEPTPPRARTLTDDLALLAAERQRLAGHFFKLIDTVFPDDSQLTDEYFQELADQPPGPPLSDYLDQLEQEFGEKR
jgi:hypothetical protein